MLTEKDISNIKVTWKTLSYPEMKCKLMEFCGHKDMSFLDMVSALYWAYIEVRQTQKEQANDKYNKAKLLLRMAVEQMAEVGDVCDCICSKNCPLDECGKFTFNDQIMELIKDE